MREEPADHVDRYVLGVRRSLRARAWRGRLDADGESLAERLSQGWGLDDVTSRLLAGRGVEPASVAAHLSPRLRESMPDPFSLAGMKEVVLRLGRALLGGEPVALFSDYDVDGLCSAALFHKAFASLGSPPHTIIPDRSDGYGLSEDIVRRLHASDHSLLVCTDCGTNDLQALALACELGLSVIIIDHHAGPARAGEMALVVNPNMEGARGEDPDDGASDLCATALVFMTLVALRSLIEGRASGVSLPEGAALKALRPVPDPLHALDLVALATLCDVVPVRKANRAFVVQGLKVASRGERLGLRVLIDQCRGERRLDEGFLTFQVGPRLNAPGRIGRAKTGYDLLISADKAEAERLAVIVSKTNEERRQIEQLATEEAFGLAETILATTEPPVLCIGSDRWHAGVIGLVAARLRERYDRPAIAIAFGTQAHGIGSGRSIEGVDLGALVRRAVSEGKLLRGGGHQMAAGLSLNSDQLEDFRDFLARSARQDVESARVFSRRTEVDALVSSRFVDKDLMASLDRLSPFGRANPAPQFVLPHQAILFASVVGERHLRLRLQDADLGPSVASPLLSSSRKPKAPALDAMAFGAMESELGPMLLDRRGQRFHLLGRPALETYQGTERLRFMVSDAALADEKPA